MCRSVKIILNTTTETTAIINKVMKLKVDRGTNPTIFPKINTAKENPPIITAIKAILKALNGTDNLNTRRIPIIVVIIV